MQLPSKWMEEAVDQVATLPGIGRKTALRLVLQLLKRSDEQVQRFTRSIDQLKANIHACKRCHNLSDDPLCGICSNPNRKTSVICAVEDIRDVLAIESTREFSGTYHVLGGIISPMDGVGPGELNIPSLVERASAPEVTEIILALSTTMEGETTAYYLYRKLEPLGVTVSTIARGVSVGGDLEYADEVTLGRSIVQRVPFEKALPRS